VLYASLRPINNNYRIKSRPSIHIERNTLTLPTHYRIQPTNIEVLKKNCLNTLLTFFRQSSSIKTHVFHDTYTQVITCAIHLQLVPYNIAIRTQQWPCTRE